jgi:tRNA-Thr(GGU) m(6)t(6)A37 methyltransferase TsaA
MLSLEPIGHVHNGIERTQDFSEVISEILILPEFEPGLYRLEESDEIDVIFIFDRNIDQGFNLKLHPKGDPSNPEVGVFASRSPFRPNPIGLQRVKLMDVSGNVVRVLGLDALEGTPVLDIKPAKRRDGR